MKTTIYPVILVLLFLFSCKKENNPVYLSDTFSVYPDRVIQDSFEAKIISPYEMISNYQSTEFQKYDPTVIFKFSINSHDNELPYGKDHLVTLKPVKGIVETLVEFGKQIVEKSDDIAYDNLPENTKWHIKLDMRNVFEAFKNDGFYVLYNGDILTKTDFKAVYIAGSAAPLSWDFSNLYARRNMELTDDDGDGIYEITLLMNSKKELKQVSNKWKLNKDISELPAYSSDYVISDAIYNMSLEEMLMAIEQDSTFRTGKEWPGVWTRDISYSIILSMAYMQPKVAQYSLMRKVKNDRIIQDTGTGGAYPVSTDRIIWAVAAWELYKANGDKNWLAYAYKVIKNTLEDDIQNAFDSQTGLMRGESSFLDWREQTYPQWMQPSDIYQSENLGTNAAHFQANMVAAQMAELLNDTENAKRFRNQAEIIKVGINKHLWQKDKNYHGQYLYGRSNMMLSPRAEALGEALTILFGINSGEQAVQTIASFPVTPFGITCIFPQIPGIPPYHNNAIWPFVQSYWALAAAKTGNEIALMAQLAAIYRASAFFLTNKENYVAETGDFAGTQVNSSVMLWSLSGNLALVHRILFGMELKHDGLVFHPFVPEVLKGKRTLTNFKYRGAKLNIEMEGFGNVIRKFYVNGKESSPEIPANLTGNIDIKIVLSNKSKGNSAINMVPVKFTPTTPVLQKDEKYLTWNRVDNAAIYSVYKNGILFNTDSINSIAIDPTSTGEYQILATDKFNNSSFLSAPLIIGNNRIITTLDKGGSVNEFYHVSRYKPTNLTIKADVSEPGLYAIKILYANGNGPVNTDSKCAFRAFYVNDKKLGTFVFPQRGANEWQNKGYSNVLKVMLSQGQQQFAIVWEPYNENMYGDINEANLYELVLERI